MVWCFIQLIATLNIHYNEKIKQISPDIPPVLIIMTYFEVVLYNTSHTGNLTALSTHNNLPLLQKAVRNWDKEKTILRGLNDGKKQILACSNQIYPKRSMEH